MKVRRKKKRRFFMVSATLVVIVILETAMLFMYNYRINAGLRDQVLDELEKESMKAKGYLQSVTQTRMNWLGLVADMSGGISEQDEELCRDMISSVESDYHSLGIFDSQGTLYYGKNKRVHCGDREYFKRAKAGEAYISSVLVNEYGEETVVLSMPMYNAQGKVIGGIVAEYTTDSIGDYIERAGMKKHTASIFFDNEGKFVSSYWDMEKYDSVYQWLETMQYKNPDAIAQVRENLLHKESGYLECFRDGRQRMIYYQPAGISDWTVFTVAEMDTYEKRLSMISEMTAVFTAFSFSMITAGIFLTGYIVKRRNKKIDEAKIDNLSGVYTRLAGQDAIRERFARERGSGCYGCLFLDLDDFKKVNDTYGHTKGDEVIETAGEILKDSVCRKDIVFRYGGDEFCVWLFGEGGRKEVEETAERILKNVAEEESGMISFSIGATVVLPEETDYHVPLERADKALYEAKEEGKSKCVFH